MAETTKPAAAPEPVEMPPPGITRPEMDKAIADAKGWVKAWTRRELELLQAGESRTTREKQNP